MVRKTLPIKYQYLRTMEHTMTHSTPHQSPRSLGPGLMTENTPATAVDPPFDFEIPLKKTTPFVALSLHPPDHQYRIQRLQTYFRPG